MNQRKPTDVLRLVGDFWGEFLRLLLSWFANSIWPCESAQHFECILWTSYVGISYKLLGSIQRTLKLWTEYYTQLQLMPCPFTGPKIFCAGPHFLCQTKNLFTYCASHKKDDLHSVKLVLGLALKIWTGTKHFGTCKRSRN